MKVLVVIFALLMFGFISLAGAFTVTQLEAQAAIAAAGGDAAIDCVFQQTGCVLALMAQTLEDHVWGANLNTYNPNDQVISTAYQRWLADCGGSPCSDMAPGNLQCVKFVEGVFTLANDPLPFHHNAIEFWGDYFQLKGWSEIGSTYSHKYRFLRKKKEKAGQAQPCYADENIFPISSAAGGREWLAHSDYQRGSRRCQARLPT